MNINEILKSDYDLLCKDYKKATKKIEKLEEDIKYYVSLKEEIREDLDNTFELMNIFKERIYKAIETINLMIYKGYTISNKETARSYMATGENSEFGVRAKELLDILKGSDKE